MAEDRSNSDDEAAAVARLLKSLDGAECAFLAAGVRCPNSAPIARGLADVKAARRRLAKALGPGARSRKRSRGEAPIGARAILEQLCAETKMPPQPPSRLDQLRAAGDQAALAKYIDGMIGDDDIPEPKEPVGEKKTRRSRSKASALRAAPVAPVLSRAEMRRVFVSGLAASLIARGNSGS